jgi:hypothetical protein
MRDISEARSRYELKVSVQDEYERLIQFLEGLERSPSEVREEQTLRFTINSEGDLVSQGTVRTTPAGKQSVTFRVFELASDHGEAGPVAVTARRLKGSDPQKTIVLRLNPGKPEGVWAVFFDPPITSANPVEWTRVAQYKGYYSGDLVKNGKATENFKRHIPTRITAQFDVPVEWANRVKVFDPHGQELARAGTTFTWNPAEDLPLGTNQTLELRLEP